MLTASDTSNDKRQFWIALRVRSWAILAVPFERDQFFARSKTKRKSDSLTEFRISRCFGGKVRGPLAVLIALHLTRPVKASACLAESDGIFSPNCFQ